MKYPKDIVLSGGGLNGIHMLKAIKMIEGRIGGTLFTQLPLRSISCSSIGSVIGLSILLDYHADEFVKYAIPKQDNFMFLFEELRVSEFVQSYGFTQNDTIAPCVDDIISYKKPEFKERAYHSWSCMI